MSKAILQTLEAIIAILMILTFFVVFFTPNESPPEFDALSQQLNGFNALNSLDKSNQLRQYVMSNNTQTLKEKLQYLLPPETEYDIVFCNQTCPSIDIQADKMTSVNYFIAGDVGDVNPKQIVLYMW